MEINFPNGCLPKVTALGTVSFQAKVDDELIWCEISLDALVQCFGAISTDSHDLLHAFYRASGTIEETARRHIEAAGGQPVLLGTADFLQPSSADY